MRRTLLLLEDETWLRDIYVRALEDKQFEVLIAGDAQAALDILDEHKEVSLVLVDILLPHHNGISFLYEAVSHLDWQDKRYVILSSVPESDINGDGELWRQLNVVDYLYKPALLPHDLPGCIERALV